MDILTRFYFITKFYTNSPYYGVAIFFSLKLGTKSQYYGVVFGLGWGRERKMFSICSMICRDFLQNVLGLSTWIFAHEWQKHKKIWSTGAWVAKILYIFHCQTSLEHYKKDSKYSIDQGVLSLFFESKILREPQSSVTHLKRFSKSVQKCYRYYLFFLLFLSSCFKFIPSLIQLYGYKDSKDLKDSKDSKDSNDLKDLNLGIFSVF